ncbi:MAG TPA: cache domain-containing protein [Syntrophorhabdaceae bacterium]|nr:cache domain-containing protein [Syntrophorhabdaceae bacterium]
MKRVVWSIAVFTAVTFFFGGIYTAYAASLEEAKALGEKAAAYVKANGKEKGAAELNNAKGQFVKGEMYVTLHDFKGVFLANPVAPAIVGQNHYDLKDPDGKYFVREMIDIAKTKGSGWMEYMWTNPATKKLQAKKSWVQRVEGTEMFTLSGIFQ